MSSSTRLFPFLLAGLATFILPLGSASQEVVELPGEDRPLRIEQDILYTVGSLAGEEWETFAEISGVSFDGDGNLYLLDAKNFRVVKIGPGGELLAEMGKAGGGPGEFGQPLSFTVTREGEIRVFDMGRQGFTIFNPDGSFKTTLRIAGADFFLPSGGLMSLPDGRMVDGGPSLKGFQVLGGDNAGPAPRPVHLFTLNENADLSTAFEAWNPLIALGGQREERLSAGGFQVSAPPQRAFDPELFVGVLRDGRLAVADTTTYTIKIVEPGGRQDRVLRRPFAPREVTRRDREAERQRQLDAVEARESSSSGPRAGSFTTDGGATHSIAVGGGQISDLLRARIEGMEFGEFMPVLAGMATDWEGRIWVERTGPRVGEDGPIDLIGPGGKYLGTASSESFRIPDAFGPGGLVAFVEADELGVPRVEVKRLRVR